MGMSQVKLAAEIGETKQTLCLECLSFNGPVGDFAGLMNQVTTGALTIPEICRKTERSKVGKRRGRTGQP